MATTVNCDDGCDLREMQKDNQYDGGLFTVGDPGTEHACGMESKELEVSPLLRFDFSAEVPNGDTITAASLFVNVTILMEQVGLNLEDYTFNIFKCLRVWPTDEATWNDWSTGNAWTVEGAGGEDTDIDTDVSASFTGPDATGWLEINVLALVNDVQGNGQILNLSMDGTQVLVGAEDFLYFRFYSYGAAANKPYLSITHEAGAPPTFVPQPMIY